MSPRVEPLLTRLNKTHIETVHNMNIIKLLLLGQLYTNQC